MGERIISADSHVAMRPEHVKNWFRDGHWEGPAHLADMDADGLAAEVVYCEVSAFRYLYPDDRYAPLWAAVKETGLPLCCHVGLNAAFDDLAQRDPTPQRALCVPLIAMSSNAALSPT